MLPKFQRVELCLLYNLSAFVVLSATLVTAQTIFPTLSTHDITVIQNRTTVFKLVINGPVYEPFNITFIDRYPDLIEISPAYIEINRTNRQLTNYTISVKGITPGMLDVTTVTEPSTIQYAPNSFVFSILIIYILCSSSFANFFFHVTIAVSPIISYTSVFVGWLYFLAWSASFYPQIYDNFQRKSVVGLNFDYLSFNLVGFVMYGAFNVGLFWSTTIQVN